MNNWWYEKKGLARILHEGFKLPNHQLDYHHNHFKQDDEATVGPVDRTQQKSPRFHPPSRDEWSLFQSGQ